MDDRDTDVEPPTDDPSATSDAPADIVVDADPNGEELNNVEESVERAAW